MKGAFWRLFYLAQAAFGSRNHDFDLAEETRSRVAYCEHKRTCRSFMGKGEIAFLHPQ